MHFQERSYRARIRKDHLVSYCVKIAESDLLISSDIDLSGPAFHALAKHRNAIESYIRTHPDFQSSFLPLTQEPMAPPIVRDMIRQSNLCGVGPMASVAGAVSEHVANDLSDQTENLIIENGGDIYLRSKNDLTIGLFAGESALSHKIHIIVKHEQTPIGICTSSGTVGHSISFGKADAVCVLSKSATLADAAASAIGNRVQTKKDIKKSLEFGMSIPGVDGVFIVIGSDMGAIGQVELG